MTGKRTFPQDGTGFAARGGKGRRPAMAPGTARRAARVGPFSGLSRRLLRRFFPDRSPGLRMALCLCSLWALLAALAGQGSSLAITIADTWTADQPRVRLDEEDFATSSTRAEAEALLEEAWAATAAATSASLPGASSGGARVWGDCSGTGFATDSTMRAFANANVGMLTLLREQIRTGQYNQGALAQAIRAESTARDRKISAMAADLNEALARATEQVALELEGRDHDREDTRQDCTGLTRAAAAQVAGLAQANAGAAMGLALASFSDGTTESFGDALHRREDDLLASSAMEGVTVMDPDWLIPDGGVIDGALNHQRARRLIDVLANPVPLPAVPDGMEDTAAGLAARAETVRKSALVEVARGALRHVYALHVPLPVLVSAVEAMEEDGGAGDGLTQEKGSDAEGASGYSQVQFLEATGQYLGGASREMALRAAGEAEVARLVADVARQRYHLETLRHRNRLWQTALLAALVGQRSAEAGGEAARHMASPR